VRHGESVANAGGVTMEHALIPLSPLGVAQAVRIAEFLPAEPPCILVSKYGLDLPTEIARKDHFYAPTVQRRSNN
jgi:broad specificity phosphatase PhoE